MDNDFKGFFAGHYHSESFGDILQRKPPGNHIVYRYFCGFNQVYGGINVRGAAVIGSDYPCLPSTEIIYLYADVNIEMRYREKNDYTPLVHALPCLIDGFNS